MKFFLNYKCMTSFRNRTGQELKDEVDPLRSTRCVFLLPCDLSEIKQQKVAIKSCNASLNTGTYYVSYLDGFRF